MNSTATSPSVTSALEDDPRWILVLRIAASPQFAKAQQLRGILLYVAQRSLMEHAAVIREYDIGCTVLGRKADFNTQEDNIVRVQVSHLRKKLEHYFLTEGLDEPLQLTIPKGSYVPRFQPHCPQAEAATGILPAVLPRRRFTKPVLAGVILTATALLALAAWQFKLAPLPHMAKAENFVWGALFASEPTNLVIADTCLVMLQDILDTDIPMAYYADGRYPNILLNQVTDPRLRSALQLISSRQYSSLADTGTSAKLLNLSRRFGDNRAHIRYARHLSLREFQTGNFILIGSRRGIPWVQLFEPQLNFVLEENPETRGYFIRNKAPRVGERTAYSPARSGDSTMETYADIAFLPNLSGTGYVLILSGIDMEGAEAAGDLVSSERFSQMLSGIIPRTAVASGGHTGLPSFEILIKTNAVAGAARSSQIVSYRLLGAA